MNKLIIFDLDGVLLDSEKLYMDMNQKFFKELGASLSLEEHEKFVGVSATKMWTYIKEKSDLVQSVEELKQMERELKFRALRETDLVPTEGVIKFLDWLKARSPTLALASSGMRKNIELILEKLGLAGYFNLVVSGEEVARGKPEPDIFLKVAGYYGRAPAECVVVEDSGNGVAAAKAAGMACLGFFNPNSGKQDLSQADLVFDHFKSPVLYRYFEAVLSTMGGNRRRFSRRDVR